MAYSGCRRDRAKRSDVVDIARPTAEDGKRGDAAHRPASVPFRLVRCRPLFRPRSMSVVLPPFTAHFATLADDYDVVLSDVWGVVHNGVIASTEACDALARFRKHGGTVVLITNAPRPGAAVARLTLDRLDVPRAAYDGIVSSGDVTHALIAARAGARVLAIGDSVRTDLKGAAAFGIDCLFVTAGIHAEELGGRSDPDPAAVSGIFAAAGVAPKAVMHRLSW